MDDVDYHIEKLAIRNEYNKKLLIYYKNMGSVIHEIVSAICPGCKRTLSKDFVTIKSLHYGDEVDFHNLLSAYSNARLLLQEVFELQREIDSEEFMN